MWQRAVSALMCDLDSGKSPLSSSSSFVTTEFSLRHNTVGKIQHPHKSLIAAQSRASRSALILWICGCRQQEVLLELPAAAFECGALSLPSSENCV